LAGSVVVAELVAMMSTAILAPTQTGWQTTTGTSRVTERDRQTGIEPAIVEEIVEIKTAVMEEVEGIGIGRRIIPVIEREHHRENVAVTGTGVVPVIRTERENRRLRDTETRTKNRRLIDTEIRSMNRRTGSTVDDDTSHVTEAKIPR